MLHHHYHAFRLASFLLIVISFAARADAQEVPREDGKADAPAAASKALPHKNATTPDSQGWSLKFTLHGHTGTVYAAAFFPDATKLLTGGDGGEVNVWDLRTGKLLDKLAVSDSDVTGVAVSSDGTLIAACADDDESPEIKIWDARTLKLLRTLKGHNTGIYEVAFSPRGNLLASGGRDKTIILWDAATGRVIRRLEGHEDSITSIVFSHDGATLASAGAAGDKTVRLWEVRTGKLLRTFEGHTDWVTSAALSPGGGVLASASRDKNIILWNAATGTKRLMLPQPEMIYELAFSPDGKTLAEVGASEQVHLHDALTGVLLGTLEGHKGAISEVKFSSDGTLLATADYDSTVIVWEHAPTKAEAKGSAPPGRRRR